MSPVSTHMGAGREHAYTQDFFIYMFTRLPLFTGGALSLDLLLHVVVAAAPKTYKYNMYKI